MGRRRLTWANHSESKLLHLLRHCCKLRVQQCLSVFFSSRCQAGSRRFHMEHCKEPGKPTHPHAPRISCCRRYAASTPPLPALTVSAACWLEVAGGAGATAARVLAGAWLAPAACASVFSRERYEMPEPICVSPFQHRRERYEMPENTYEFTYVFRWKDTKCPSLSVFREGRVQG